MSAWRKIGGGGKRVVLRATMETGPAEEVPVTGRAAVGRLSRRSRIKRALVKSRTGGVRPRRASDVIISGEGMRLISNGDAG
jgi:hypothetical protein